MGGTTMSYELVINQQLPSYNEYINACRSHWSKGAAFKSRIEKWIEYAILCAKAEKKLAPFSDPCVIYIEWHEKTKKRDVDNIQSAQKFILDALQTMNIIPNDSRRYVKQIHHNIVDDDRDYVVVRFKEAI
jgi:Holliday junction resolvase RusA-like endonuclease